MRLKKEVLFLLVFAILCINTEMISLGEDRLSSSTDYRIVEKNKVWKIEFTRTVDLTYVNDETVYIKDMDGRKIEDCEILIKNDKTITIAKDGGFQSGEMYELVISDTIRDIDGEKLQDGRKVRFKIEGESKGGFYAKRAELVSKKEMLVEFSRDLDVAAEVPIFYEMKDENGNIAKGSYDNFSIKRFEENPKMIIITVKNNDISLEDGVFLKVSGELVDKKRERFNQGESEWILVKSIGEKQEFGVKSVNLIGNRILEVKFTSELDKKEGEKEANFRIYDPNDNSVLIDKCIVHDGNTVRINLKSRIEDIGKYTLNIRSLKDFTGYSSIKNEEETFVIDGIHENKIKYSAKALNRRMIELKFDEKLSKSSAIRIYNYFLVSNDGTDKERIIPAQNLYFDENTQDRVVLYFSFDLMDPEGYRVKVMRTLENEFGDRYDADSKYTIKSSSAAYIFDLADQLVGEDYIDLEFSSEVFQNAEVMRKEEYKLILDEGDGRTITIDCNGVEFVNGKTIRVTFKGMREGESYKLYCPTFQGYFGEESKFITGIEIDR